MSDYEKSVKKAVKKRVGSNQKETIDLVCKRHEKIEMAKRGELELEEIKDLARQLNKHKIKSIDNTVGEGWDLPEMNKACNQKGRGNYRTVYDANTGEYMGIYEHTPTNGYRKVA